MTLLFLEKKVPLDHFNDGQGLCCALQLKDAPSRAAGPGRTRLRVDKDESPARSLWTRFAGHGCPSSVTEQVGTGLIRSAQPRSL